MTLLRLMLEFFKTGLFSVGGGLATLPFLYEISDRFPRWFSHADIADMIAISESTPGPIGINMSTYAGYRTAGILGGVLASLALAKFRQNRLVESAFYGLRPASIAMISVAGLNVVRVALVDMTALTSGAGLGGFFIWKAIALAVLIFIGLRKLKWSPIAFIAISAVVGIVFKF